VQVGVSDGFVEATTSFAFSVIDDRIPVVTILTPEEGTLFQPGDELFFSGEAVDFEGAPIAPENLSWQLLVHHNQHVHFDGMPAVTGTGGSFVADDHGDNTHLELCLIATDNLGREAETCRELMPVEVDLTIASVPAGISIPWEGSARVTPFTVRTHVGGVRTLSAPTVHSNYQFVSWSDGGTAAHDILIGGSPLTLTATYQQTGPAAGTYRLRAEHSLKCVEHRPATYFLWFQTAPERFAQYPCGSAAAQRFALTDNGDGSFRLIASNRALAANGTAENGTIVPVAYAGAAAQRWTATPSGSRYMLVNAGSSKCLEAQAGSTADNTTYVQTTCASRASQLFELIAP
jgi:hypothetical protein